MRYSALGTNYVIRLDAGEKVVESLLYLCEREGIGSGFFNGLGAAGEAGSATSTRHRTTITESPSSTPMPRSAIRRSPSGEGISAKPLSR